VSASAIGFAGLTHLGLCSAVAAASKGFRVVGYDRDSARVKEVAEGRWPVLEPGLVELAGTHGARLAWRDDIGALGLCDVVYIASDVPTDESGRSDLSGIIALIERVTPVLKQEAILVVLCQVPPGFTRGLAFPLARLFYQVETLVFGRAMERASSPERFIIGCADSTAQLPPAFHDFLSAFGCPILPMRYESAELAKISINCCLVASISVANTMAEVCEKIGADWSEIIPALKLDKRIGQHAYLAPGLGLAGGNLERDLATVCSLGDTEGTDVSVVRAWIANSRHRRDWVLTQVHERVIAHRTNPTFAVLGLAYKEDTASTKNSASLSLLRALSPFTVRVYDPVVEPRREFHPHLLPAPSALDACSGADALVLMTPWNQFRQLDPLEIAKQLRGAIVIDPYGVLNAKQCRAAGLDYVTLGVA
jgi:UDPglucose 6-dehydrogenase